MKLEMTVEPFMGNLNGTLHGGAIATVIDVATTIAVMSLDKKNRANVSSELNMSFLSSSPIGREVFIMSQVDRIGKNVAFTQCWLYSDVDELLVSGRHIKSFLPTSFNLEGDGFYPTKI